MEKDSAPDTQPSSKATIFCLTPVKNEAWILGRYLACARTWADHIIVADQCSDDCSREMVVGCPIAAVVENRSPIYDEGARQRLLIEAARAMPTVGKRILFALDADEMLTANWSDSPEWQQVLEAPAGTVIRLDWVNLLPGLQECWIPEKDIPFGFVDDGRAHVGQTIHSTRLPAPEDAPTIHLRDIKVLHYQYAAWERMRSKQRWYQCWELLNHPKKRPIQIFRQYNFMRSFPPSELNAVRPEWLEGYERQGIDMKTITQDSMPWWDREVAELIFQHGAKRFRRLDIWDKDWETAATESGIAAQNACWRDPRTLIDKRIHRWLERTQGQSKDRKVRWAQRALLLLGW